MRKRSPKYKVPLSTVVADNAEYACPARWNNNASSTKVSVGKKQRLTLTKIERDDGLYNRGKPVTAIIGSVSCSACAMHCTDARILVYEGKEGQRVLDTFRERLTQVSDADKNILLQVAERIGPIASRTPKPTSTTSPQPSRRSQEPRTGIFSSHPSTATDGTDTPSYLPWSALEASRLADEAIALHAASVVAVDPSGRLTPFADGFQPELELIYPDTPVDIRLRDTRTPVIEQPDKQLRWDI